MGALPVGSGKHALRGRKRRAMVAARVPDDLREPGCSGQLPAPAGSPSGDRVSAGLPAGTRVQARGTGRRRQGVVMPHDPEYSHGSFPVRFDDGIWEVLDTSYVIALALPEGSDQ